MTELFPPSAAETAASPSDTALCEQCNSPFTPRKGKGGKPQRFCSRKCRQAFHAQREHSVTAEQPSETDAQVSTDSSGEPGRPSDGREFDWSEMKEDVVIHGQLAVAVYFNPRGGLVIRQERDFYDDQDHLVVISSENIETFIDKITDIVGIPSIGRPDR